MAEERLQKILARGGISSRRAAEALIADGRVRINGKTVRELGTKADPGKDRIDVDGKRVVAEQAVYVALHKPRGVVATMSDPEGRPTVAELLSPLGARVYPVGRLDFATSGLMLATNDGDFTNALLHPKKKVPKTYVLKVAGEMKIEDLDLWREGVDLEDGKTLPAQVKLLRHEAGKSWIEVTIHEGRNQQIRRMGEATGFPVMRLARLAFAGISSEGLAPGRHRSLSREELVQMKKDFGVPKRIPGGLDSTTQSPGRTSFRSTANSEREARGETRERRSGFGASRDDARNERGDGHRADSRTRTSGGDRPPSRPGARAPARTTAGDRDERRTPERRDSGSGRAPSRGPAGNSRARVGRGPATREEGSDNRPTRGNYTGRSDAGGGRTPTGDRGPARGPARGTGASSDRGRPNDRDGARSGPPRDREDTRRGDDRGPPRDREDTRSKFGGDRGGSRTGGPSGDRGGSRTGGPSGDRGGSRTGGPSGDRGGSRTGGPGGDRGGSRTGGPGGDRGGGRTGGPGADRGGSRTGGPGGDRGGGRTGGRPGANAPRRDDRVTKGESGSFGGGASGRRPADRPSWGSGTGRGASGSQGAPREDAPPGRGGRSRTTGTGGGIGAGEGDFRMNKGRNNKG